jgi:hypothetical protein
VTAADVAPDLAEIRAQVVKLSSQADHTLVQIDRLRTICAALEDVRDVQQDMRQALLFILDYLDKIDPK